MHTLRTRPIFARVLLAALIVAAGLAARAFLDGPIAKYSGVALYAALIYAIVSIAWPTARPRQLFAVSLAFCFAIELFQLTPIPARLAEIHRAFALVFGTTFHWPDLIAYAAGAAVAAVAHNALVRA